jgi:uncharacterized protein with HEPN domain
VTPTRVDPRVLVDDMLQYCGTIAHWVSKGHEAFRDPETGSQATIERQFERFEEAANALGASFRTAHPGIPWRPVFEIRNDLSRPCERSYDPEKLWRFAANELPRIARKLRRVRLPPSSP